MLHCRPRAESRYLPLKVWRHQGIQQEMSIQFCWIGTKMIKPLSEKDRFIRSDHSHITQWSFTSKDDIVPPWNKPTRPTSICILSDISDFFRVNEAVAYIAGTYHLEGRWLTYDGRRAVHTI